jgi:nucleotide-binding universal stress UspA family protein
LRKVNARQRRAGQTGPVVATDHPTMHILVAVDGSAYTKRMLAYLAAHDEWLGTLHRYTVVHAVPALPTRVVRALDRGQVDAYYASGSNTVFKPIRTFVKQQGLDATFLSKVGAPAEVIARLAQTQKFGLLMLGSHGHGALAGLVLGSVATQVLAACKLPVLLVR